MAAQPAPQPAPTLRRPPRLRFLLLGTALALLLGVGLFTTFGSGGVAGRPGPGDAAPTFSLPRLFGGAPVGIPADGGAGGRPAVVLFYASSCVPCQAEIPRLAATYRRQQAAHRGAPEVALIGVAASDPAPARFARASGVTFPVGLDSSLDVTNGRYYFTALPEAVFVNGDGTISAIHYGAITPGQLLSGEAHLLAADRGA